MVLNISGDPMAFLNDQIAKGQEKPTGQFKPVLFRLGDNEKALIRPLRNLNEFVLVHKHELFNQANPKESINAVCAADYDLECLLCQQVQTNKKLASSVRFLIPVYVYKIMRKRLDDKGKVILDKGSPVWEQVTYKDANEEEHPVAGFRLLEMKRTSSILLDLNSLYGEEGDITKSDIVIERKGAGLDTKYTTTVKAPAPFKAEIEESTDREAVLALYADACPFQIVDSDAAPARPATSAKSGKTTIDDDF